ncbi:uncharacterized protein N7477_001511 [Penicillium maclennaniae]|uniref:uncharacterized protein n=1 Tax=Penicillium maclennaniae TaxID=1343394 RepID=UPI002540F58B|nr:uncharacterized protein N7477_001511 [Penicillium maclennaniae]KAJ5681571.1 hypothetical protein N7477_001511 [Penicillium maclennaniae]
MAKQLATLLSTTLNLIEQFQETVSSSVRTDQPSSKDAQALPLLSASSTGLKAQVTKLSLLTITSPFTHSAVTGVLRACNDSVLPSLVTAAMLVTPADYTKAFQAEVCLLVRAALSELKALVVLVKEVFEKKEKEKLEDPKKKEGELVKSEKEAVTRATGRVWDSCDAVAEVATKGVVGFVMHRVEQWRDLVRDAVQEIEDWDPEEEDDSFDDLMEDEDKDDDDDDDDEDDEEDTAALKEQKTNTLRFLKPVAQVYPSIATNRLKNAGDAPLSSAGGVAKLEALMLNLQSIPDQVDEAAGALYEANMAKSAKFLKKAQKHAAEAVASVASPWNEVEAGDKKVMDKFSIWSSAWFKVMAEVSKPIDAFATA